MNNIRRFLFLFAVISVLSINSFAITWFPVEVSCPVDGEKNTFLEIGSYGSYIYSYPSKYQWLFFPRTDSPTYYICKKCHYAAYMWDFKGLPREKIPEVKKMLAGIKISKPFKDYDELAVSERLEVMEKVYALLGKDENWWENFYRVKGYHYHAEGMTEKAAEARRKSLDMVQKELKNEKSITPKKLLYYISAAMKHFLSDDKGALEDLQKAIETKYEEKGAKPEDIKGAEDGLNERARDYIERIKSTDKKPRDMKESGH